MTGYDQAGLDGTLTYVSLCQNFSLHYASNLVFSIINNNKTQLAHTIWNIELYDVIASENGHEDFKEHCKKLLEDATPDIGAQLEATTGPPMIPLPDGRSFLAKIFCGCTGPPEDIESASVLSTRTGKSSTL